jgi:predicted sugar kinase
VHRAVLLVPVVAGVVRRDMVMMAFLGGEAHLGEEDRNKRRQKRQENVAQKMHRHCADRQVCVCERESEWEGLTLNPKPYLSIGAGVGTHVRQMEQSARNLARGRG